MNELFTGWSEHPPTNLLVKAIVEGLGGGKTAQIEHEAFEPSPAAEYAMRSAVSQISSKAGPAMPVIHGRDHDLPKAPPMFDIEEMKRRNASILAKRQGNV